MTCSFSHDDGSGCQFNVGARYFIRAASGNVFCPFHLPIDENVPGSRAKSKWNSKEKSVFEDLFTEYIERNKEKILDFEGAVFPIPVNLSAKKLGNDRFFSVCCKKAQFHDSVTFEGLSISEGADFRHSVYYEAANFSDVIFHGTINFDNSIFRKGANFSEAIFKGDVSFIRVTTDTKQKSEKGFVFSIKNAVFESNADFNEAHIQNAKFVASGGSFPEVGFTNFKNFRCNSGADFEGRNFLGPVSFFHAGFEPQVSFGGAVFWDPVSFEGPPPFTGGTMSFEHTVFKSGTSFSHRELLRGTTFPYTKFWGQITTVPLLIE